MAVEPVKSSMEPSKPAPGSLNATLNAGEADESTAGRIGLARGLDRSWPPGRCCRSAPTHRPRPARLAFPTRSVTAPASTVAVRVAVAVQAAGDRDVVEGRVDGPG